MFLLTPVTCHVTIVCRRCRRVLKTAEMYNNSWEAEKSARHWSVAHFRGKELSHETMRWSHIRDAFGSELKFTQTQFENIHGLMYQMRLMKNNSGNVLDVVMELMKRFVNHHNTEFDPLLFMDMARALDIAIRGNYGPPSHIPCYFNCNHFAFVL